MKMSKRTKAISSLVDKNKTYSLDEAVAILKKAPPVKFNESVDISFKLNVDHKQSDQMVRGTVVLPNGTGKNVKVLVFCKGEASQGAKEAGADYVGAEELINKVNSGWIDFDVVISSPEMMKDVGRLGKILGPRGLMPNPKIGTVTNDLKKAVTEAKAGRIEFKIDKQGNINASLGKLSFKENQICENALSLIESVNRARPQTVKGRFVKSIYISSTMGPGLKLDLARIGVN